MRKICIVAPRVDGYYSEEVAKIDLTPWTEVTDQEYNILKCWETKGDYTVLDMPDQKEFIKKTVTDYKKYVAQLEREEAAEKEKREAAKRQRELKKRAKTEAEELKLLQELQVKYKDKE